MKTLGRSSGLLVFALSATLSLVVVNALPNLRIQVNNENLQSPPYLLEDAPLNQANKSTNSLEQTASSTASTSTLKNQSPSTTPTSRIQASSSNETELDDEESAPTAGPNISGGDDDDDAAESNGGSFSVIKEETIEEMLDLEPESVIKPAPVSSVGPAMDEYRPTFGSGQASAGPESSSLTGGESNSNHNNHNLNEPLVLQPPHDSVPSISRKPVQLAVANSHLKKPASTIGDSDDGSSGGTAAVAAAAALAHESEPQKKATGAKSLVVLAVLKDAAPDDGATITNMGAAKQLKRKTTHENPPDVWEPSQVMSGVSNASLVPAVVNRDYGTQTRTRITLGGGYVRDRLPPLGSSAAPSADSKPLESVSPSLSSSMVGAKLVASSSSSGNSDNLSIDRIAQPAVAGSQTVAKDKTLTGAASTVATAAAAAAGTNATTVAQLGRQQRLDSRCPKMGVKTFEHPTACDRYYYCEDGYLSEQSCPNGLLYGTRETVLDFCVHRWKATCDDRAIPNPISSPGCRWQYGIFSVQGSPKCTPDYYECIEGRFEVRKCSVDGQVYDDRTKSCQFAEAVGCAQETLGEFQCPPDDQANTYWPFPRYFYNERALIHCVNDKPELIRCLNGEVVDPEHLHCVPPAKLAAKSAAPSAGVPAERRTTRERKKDTS